MLSHAFVSFVDIVCALAIELTATCANVCSPVSLLIRAILLLLDLIRKCYLFRFVCVCVLTSKVLFLIRILYFILFYSFCLFFLFLFSCMVLCAISTAVAGGVIAVALYFFH